MIIQARVLILPANNVRHYHHVARNRRILAPNRDPYVRIFGNVPSYNVFDNHNLIAACHTNSNLAGAIKLVLPD